ncbi:uncharacterized protein LOC122665539 [Telopea speciosissima]|uniref:uncharacterized protein LOC122665539 n=1 Tax=Telopea speciosissima TaxID=54955 RepID=UPI001CC59705|nr:uncharacterized protein LOC122665539 [Telopea speciosissima]
MNIQRHTSSPYRPQTNGPVEAANKNIKRTIQKMADKHNKWTDKLHYALWASRTSIRTSTGETPYSLVYGMEAVLLVELEIPSIRVMMDSDIPEANWIKTRFQELNLIDEKSMRAIDNMKKYKQRMIQTFNKKVVPHQLSVGDLVLKEQRAPIQNHEASSGPIGVALR